MAGPPRNSTAWARPSFGLQAGLEQAELVFIINSDRALRGIEHGNFKLGAGAGLTVVEPVVAARKAPPPPMAAISWSGPRPRAPMAA